MEVKLEADQKEAMAAVMVANRAAIDAMKSESEKQKIEVTEELGKQHSDEKGTLWTIDEIAL